MRSVLNTCFVHRSLWLCSIHGRLSFSWMKVAASSRSHNTILLSLRKDTSRHFLRVIFFSFLTVLSFLYLIFKASKCFCKRGLHCLIFSLLVALLPLMGSTYSIFQLVIHVALLFFIQLWILNPVHCAFIQLIDMFFSFFSQPCPGIHITLDCIWLSHTLIKPTAIIVCNNGWIVARSWIDIACSSLSGLHLWFNCSISIPRWL